MYPESLDQPKAAEKIALQQHEFEYKYYANKGDPVVIEKLRVGVFEAIPVDFLDKMPDDQVILKELCTKMAIMPLITDNSCIYKVLKSNQYIKK